MKTNSTAAAASSVEVPWRRVTDYTVLLRMKMYAMHGVRGLQTMSYNTTEPNGYMA
eukprot:COSAG02_NODE_70964_length_193_cov_19.851064_1_plen_55_part_10